MVLLLLIFSPVSSEAGVRLEGVPAWLRSRMERSADVVWSEIAPKGVKSAGKDALDLLSVVAERVFSGYTVTRAFFRDGDVVLRLEPLESFQWEVEISPPQLVSPVKEWFLESATGLDKKIEKLIAPLPLEALSWADIPLKEAIESECAPHVPGWSPSLLVRLQDGKRILHVSFSPKPPFVLAVLPNVSSLTLPVVLRSDLKENMLRSLSPVVGLPIEWASANKERIQTLAAESLRGTNIVGNARATVDVAFNSAQLSAANAVVESPRYAVRAWIAAYAGTDDDGKYPEVGLHLGRKFLPVSGFGMELYGEWLLCINDFNLESRWGIRWNPWRKIMAGVEHVFPGGITWYRLWVDGGIRSPYVWWRVSEIGDQNIGVGYRLNDRISFEIHYDDRDEDKLSLKAIGDL